MSQRYNGSDLNAPLISDTSSINIGLAEGSARGDSVSSFFSQRRARDDPADPEEEMRRFSKVETAATEDKLDSTISNMSAFYTGKSLVVDILQKAVAAVLVPFVVGALICILSWRNRGVATAFNNQHDWFVLFLLGLLHQTTLLVPILWFTGAYDDLVTKLWSRGDFYGPFVIYPVSSMLYSLMLISFWLHEKRNQSRMKQSMRATRRQVIEQHREAIRVQVAVRSEFWCLVPSFIIACPAFLLIRVCSLTLSNCGTSMFTFLNDEFASDIYFELSNFFDFVNLYVMTSVLSFALMYYYQQLCAMQEFVYSDTTAKDVDDADNENSSKRLLRSGDSWLKRMPNGGMSPTSPKRARKRKPWMDLGARDGLAEYAGVFQALTSDLKYRSLSNAVTGVSFMTTAVVLVFGGIAVVVQNIFAGDHVAEFSIAVISIIGISVPFFIGFIYVTIQIEKVIESLNAAISRVHLDVQVEITEGSSLIPPDRKRALQAKVNALQALDRYVRLAGGTPRLSGLSLNSLKWTGIFVGLFTLNCCFFFLYIKKCKV